MNTLISRSAPVGVKDLDSRLAQNDAVARRRNRPAEWVRAHSATLWWLAPIVVIAAVVNAINVANAPAQTAGEGTITAQAWAVGHLGQLTPYTYTYNQPPLGWLQIAAWTGLTGGFSRYGVAVVAAREAMVVAALVSVVLLWFVARRLGFGRIAAGVGTIVFALSPLAIHFHRMVDLDNVATPWLLASLLLATARRNQLIGFAGSAVALGIAALSSETYLLALPLVAFLMWRNAHPETRRYTLAVAATALILVFGAYALFALVQGQFFAASNHPSLISGLASEFGAGGPGGSQAGAWQQVGDTLTVWRQLDPVQFFVAPVVAIAGLLIRRVRPFAVALALLLAFVLVFGFVFGLGFAALPASSIVIVLPIAALVIAGVTDHVLRLVHFSGLRARLRVVAAVAVLAIAGLALVATWAPGDRSLLVGGQTPSAARDAEQWVTANVPKNSRLIVDDTSWVDLVTAGFARDNVVWFPKLDTDRAVRAQSPQGWKDSDFVISTHAMRTAPDAATADSAIANSVVVASFGTGESRVQVRRIVPAGAARATADQNAEKNQRLVLGNEVDGNPTVIVNAAASSELREGRVDPRISLLLGQLASTGTVSVSRFPIVSGEAGLPIRQVVLRRVGGKALTSRGKLTAAGHAVVASLDGPFAAQSAKAVPGGLLVEFSIGLPAGIIQ